MVLSTISLVFFKIFFTFTFDFEDVEDLVNISVCTNGLKLIEMPIY
ncbi:hypothetical protein Cycma_1445 [Cyclobacterium marinum DSM 745]|uniref:Uncharacterized protein n=1 Tax=Cyclobacterium marinum (strain ATCC 25205 / DSM 745 / LMG 13164 / NCIMB 1802) TaxID=880070 RepID=G0J2E0_CYCMS|nr:hypothetical protein Cycma_1445 [Cyclobacterium marinum DSM 745]